MEGESFRKGGWGEEGGVEVGTEELDDVGDFGGWVKEGLKRFIANLNYIIIKILL